jgi:hypothetical protein
MNNVETNLLMKLDRSLVSTLQPEKVMEAEPPFPPVRIQGVEPPRHGQPVKIQICVLVVSKKSLNTLPVVWIRQNANLMPLRQLQSPIPCKAGFGPLLRTTSVTDDQYLHFHCLR